MSTLDNTDRGTRRRSIAAYRSVAKALTYRALIICLDFLTIYLLTGTVRLAVWFMIVSNTYTTLAYVVHERVWARVPWGVS